MKYFVTLNLLRSTTKLGQLLSDIVFKRYENALVNDEEASAIPRFLEEKIAELCAGNPRLKPMAVHTTGFSADNRNIQRWASAQIFVCTKECNKAWTDNRPFTIQLTPVAHDRTCTKGDRPGDGGAGTQGNPSSGERNVSKK